MVAASVSHERSGLRALGRDMGIHAQEVLVASGLMLALGLGAAVPAETETVWTFLEFRL